jgi:hypothetical protein
MFSKINIAIVLHRRKFKNNLQSIVSSYTNKKILAKIFSNNIGEYSTLGNIPGRHISESLLFAGHDVIICQPLANRVSKLHKF